MSSLLWGLDESTRWLAGKRNSSQVQNGKSAATGTRH
jgi:hypothetical protein